MTTSKKPATTIVCSVCTWIFMPDCNYRPTINISGFLVYFFWKWIFDFKCYCTGVMHSLFYSFVNVVLSSIPKTVEQKFQKVEHFFPAFANFVFNVGFRFIPFFEFRPARFVSNQLIQRIFIVSVIVIVVSVIFLVQFLLN